MDDQGNRWAAVDDYLISHVVRPDPDAEAARAAGHEAGLPDIEVAANQGALLGLLCRIAGARRVLEFGTLAGYSTIWLARAVGPDGHVTTLELDDHHADVATANLVAAGVADRVRVRRGPALDSVAALAGEHPEPFDLVFIDADKPNIPAYFDAALTVCRPGSVLVCDNVVRDGKVTDAGSADPAVLGVRALLGGLGAREDVLSTAVQTVGRKGWDGLSISVVT